MTDLEYIEDFIVRTGVVDLELTWTPFVHLLTDMHVSNLAAACMRVDDGE